MNLFGLLKAKKAKKEAERKAKEEKDLAEAAMKKKAYRERKEKIISYINNYDKELEKKINEKYENDKKEVEKKNSTCPRCGSKNVVHKVTRTKGEIHGEGHSSGCGSLGGSLFGLNGYISQHGYSSIDGELDTLQINRCKDCEEEWNIEEAEEPSYHGNVFSNYDSFVPGFLFRRLDEYYTMKYDPYDEKCEFDSLEEMREDFFKRYSKGYYFEDYRTCPRYMIEYALYKGFTEHYYTLDDLDKKLYNYNKDDDAYSYTMSDSMWEIVKKMIGWKGTEE